MARYIKECSHGKHSTMLKFVKSDKQEKKKKRQKWQHLMDLVLPIPVVT